MGINYSILLILMHERNSMLQMRKIVRFDECSGQMSSVPFSFFLHVLRDASQQSPIRDAPFLYGS